MKTVIEMAKEAGLQHVCDINYPVVDVALERFAALVREDERKEQALQCLSDIHQEMEQQEPVAWMCLDLPWLPEHMTEKMKKQATMALYATPPTIEAAVLAEREACAKVCIKIEISDWDSDIPMQCAAAIRARSK